MFSGEVRCEDEVVRGKLVFKETALGKLVFKETALREKEVISVSYTHLTLPTIYSV